MTTPDPRMVEAAEAALAEAGVQHAQLRHRYAEVVLTAVDPLRQADTVPVDRQALRRLLDADTQTDIADAVDHLDTLVRPHLEQQ